MRDRWMRSGWGPRASRPISVRREPREPVNGSSFRARMSRMMAIGTTARMRNVGMRDTPVDRVRVAEQGIGSPQPSREYSLGPRSRLLKPSDPRFAWVPHGAREATREVYRQIV